MAYKSVLECAISQIGQGNGANKPNKYTRWYYGNETVAPWCAIFMAWCFNQVGIYSRLDGLTNKAGCEPWRRWAVGKGIWGTKPRANAIVLYDWNKAQGDGADHIGIVEKVTSSGVIAIEGNTSANGSQSNGGYVMRKTRYNADIMGYIYVDTIAPQPQPKPVLTPTKIAGANRYKTNQAVLGNGVFDSAVLVSGETYADALSAAHLCRTLKAPLVLTDREGKQAEAWINSHIKKNVYIIGGDGVIADEYAERLAQRYTVTRYAGVDRYETNIELLKTFRGFDTLAIVSGRTFADGLTAGSLNMPVMLVGKELTPGQRAWIRENYLYKAYIIGGTAAVNKAIEAELGQYTTVARIAGANRYETAAEVAKAFYYGISTLAITTGKGFADGLSALNLGAMPLLLVDSTNYQAAQKYITTQTLQKAYVIGGTVPDSAINWALTKLPTTPR